MKSWLTQLEGNLSDLFQEDSNLLQGSLMEESASAGKLDAITKYLTQLSLLYEIPFNYLIPSEEVLPENAIRFFYLDNKWLFSLLDGASSIGRNTELDQDHDEFFLEGVYQNVVHKNENVRRTLLGKEPIEDLQNTDETPVFTGFLLRSSILLKHFRGIEFIAKGKQGVLPALRIEALSEDVLLAIFKGELESITIKEPMEGLKYSSNSEVIALRDGNQRVLDIKGSIENQTGGTKPTSAEIAAEMIDTGKEILITIKGGGSKNE